MKLLPEEISIIGNWIYRDGLMINNDNSKRIEWLINNSLELISVEDGGWSKIYVDPDDGRYWNRIFPKGEMQGGGPPALESIGNVTYLTGKTHVEVAIQKYIIL